MMETVLINGCANAAKLVWKRSSAAKAFGGNVRYLTIPAQEGVAIAAPDISKPRQGHGQFDTYRFVTELEREGVPRNQAVAIMEQALLAISEAHSRQIALVATKQDLLTLKSEVNEKVFSSTLKFGENDSEEPRVYPSRSATPQGVDEQRPRPSKGRRDAGGEVRHRQGSRRDHRAGKTKIAALERRVILQYGIGFFGSIIALGLAVARIAMV